MDNNYCPLHKIKIQLGPYIVYDSCISEVSYIYLAYNTDMDKKCYAKIIEINIKDQEFERLIQNYQTISQIVDENIIRVYNILEHQKYCYIFLEFCETDLSKSVSKPFELRQVLDFIFQISKGYLALMNYNIIHRDMKPDNILVNQDIKQNRQVYKICDFGLSKIMQGQKLQTFCLKGTVAYAAPEIKEFEFSHAADAYSFGLILLEVLIQDNLEQGSQKQLEQFLQKYRFKQWFEQSEEQQQKLLLEFGKLHELKKLKDIDSFLLDVLSDLLVYQREKRITWQQLNDKVKKRLEEKLPKVQINSAIFQQKIPQINRLSQSQVIQIKQQPDQQFQQPFHQFQPLQKQQLQQQSQSTLNNNQQINQQNNNNNYTTIQQSDYKPQNYQQQQQQQQQHFQYGRITNQVVSQRNCQQNQQHCQTNNIQLQLQQVQQPSGITTNKK